MKILDNGDVSFPKKGKPPPDLTNYVRDPGDPFLFHPKFVECNHRIYLKTVAPCGRESFRWVCNLKNETVSVPYCSVCTVEPKIF